MAKTKRYTTLISGGVQAALLVICVWVWGTWMENRLTNAMADSAAAQARKTVDQLAVTLADDAPGRDQVGSATWERDEQRIRRIGANGDYVAVYNLKTNQLLHHGLQSRQIRSHTVEALPIFQPSDPRAKSWTSISPLATVIGQRVPNSDLAVVYYQTRYPYKAEAHRMLGPLQQMGLCVALLTAVGSGIMLSSVANRYEDKISNVNDELDSLVTEQMREFMRTRDAIIYGLARLAESRDTDTGEHLDRIQYYSTMLARRLAKKIPQIDEEYIQKLRLASTLHDIGKVGIPDEILLKPGRLTERERRVMQQHAVIGSQCLREIRERLGNDDFLDMAHNIAVGHHERWDGDGYPYGVAGEKIPLEARIVAVADVYDALRSRRVYKDALSHERAVSIIREGSGTQFDPAVVAAFEECSDEFEKQSQASSEEPEMCLLEKIRECLHSTSEMEDIDVELNSIFDDVEARKPVETPTP